MIPALMIAMMPLAACGPDSITGPSIGSPLAEGAVSADTVESLAVVAATDSTATLRWTQVAGAAGDPASYEVRFAPRPIQWNAAGIGCDNRLDGTRVGAAMSCTIEGLDAGTTYDVQLSAFTIIDGVPRGATLSNIATVAVDDSVGIDTVQASHEGIWVSANDVGRLPMSGAAWSALLSDAGRDPGSADISDQDSNHDVYTMAAALVCARSGQYCAKARDGVLNAMGTEMGGRWLAVGRNLAAYVIAADLLGLRADGVTGSAGTRVESWIEGWLSRRLPDNNTGELRSFEPFHSGANAAAQEGLAYAAVASYLEDAWALDRAWDAFRTFAGDPGAPDREHIDLTRPSRDGWTHSDARPYAINPVGTSKSVPAGASGAGGSPRRIDGALVGDMRRGGTYQWEPGYTQYVWVGLEGVVPAAVILDMAGYPAFEVADRAVLRTHEYLWYLRTETGDARWFDGDRARDIVQLVNAAYGTSFPVNGSAGAGRTVGYTDWTHPQGR